jgi:3-deoxy-D-manno-octulosonic-acid transferase
MSGPNPIRAEPQIGRVEPRPGGNAAGRPLAISAYRLITRLARPAAGLVLGLRARQGKEDAQRRGERLGRASVARPSGLLIWTHAASVGEASSILPLLATLSQRRPDLAILLTTGTVTSARFVATRLPTNVIHQFVPLDSPAFVARFLEHWRPWLAVFTEQEIWPNLVLETHARAIPIALVNARMSERTFARWQARPEPARALFSCFSIVLAQNDALAARYQALGASRVTAIGNLKIDAPPPPADPTALAALEAALTGRPRLVAASTHEGEERLLAAAHRALARRFAGFCTLIAPRHPHRGPSIAAALAADGFRVAQRSIGELPREATDIYIADTIGELGTLYAASPLAFVGGSLVAHGGQNPIEAIRHGSVVLTGPSRFNFEDAYDALLGAGGAFLVDAPDAIVARAAQLLENPAALEEARRRGARALDGLQGALERTLTALAPLVPQPIAEPTRAP